MNESQSKSGNCRTSYFVATIVVIPLGLASRKFGDHLPTFIATYAGDTLWALMVFLGISSLKPDAPLKHRAVAALAFAFTIEFFQLCQAPWIETIRDTIFGKLVLGSGFLWSDLLCYSIGIAAGAGADPWLSRSSREDASA
ncbi:MAG: DUF2809 domain-containing protein [Limisphaerales bacterium]